MPRKPNPLLVFIHTLSADLPFDTAPLLTALEKGSDPSLIAAQSGRLLREAFSAQQRTLASLRAQADSWQRQAEAYRHSWEACQREPVREQLLQAQSEIAALQTRLTELESRLEQSILQCAFLEKENIRLRNLLDEQQEIIARQQIRLLELEGDDA